MDGLNIDFIPAKLYVPCLSSFKNFLDSELRSLKSAIDNLNQESEYTKLLDCLFIRFNNQLRRIRFFKSFCSFRRSIRHVRFGVPTKGIYRFHMLLKSVDRKSTCPSLHSFDHVLVCILQLHRLIKLSIARSFSCWKVCDLQFVTGHFTKVLLLIMTLLAGLRLILVRIGLQLQTTYENLREARSQYTVSESWLPRDVSLPHFLDPIRGISDIPGKYLSKEEETCSASTLRSAMKDATTSTPIIEPSSKKQLKKARKSSLQKRMTEEFKMLQSLHSKNSVNTYAPKQDALLYALLK